MVLGAVKVMEIGYDGCVLWLEGCPKDDMVGGSKIGRVLMGCEKKSGKRYRPIGHGVIAPVEGDAKRRAIAEGRRKLKGPLLPSCF
ncbi:hypothetical protein BHE74_00020328 [Ensete ventricosum]|nr:hypothetical protein BHE74_00020328 [Ensete ventricosum]